MTSALKNPQPEIPGVKYVRKRFRIPGEKVCKICGDKALAHHFSVLSCESCKAFFRRNAIKQSELIRCLFEGDCTITKSTRKNCAACRLKKCFDAGMKPELIFDECQKKELKKKIKEKRAKQAKSWADSSGNADSNSSACAAISSGATCSPCLSPKEGNSLSFSSSSSPCQTSSSGGTPAVDVNETSYSPGYSISHHSLATSLLERMAIQESDKTMAGKDSAHDDPNCLTFAVDMISCCDETILLSSTAAESSLHTSGSKKAAFLDDTLFGITPHSQMLSSAHDSLFSRSVPQKKPQEFQLVSHSQLPSDPQMYWRLSEEERMLLTLLSSVYEDTVLSSLKVCHKNERDLSNLSISDFLDDYDTQVRHTISFVRRLEDFRRLASDEQITVFKSSIAAVSQLRYGCVFVEERRTWLLNIGEFKEEQMKKLFSFHPYIDYMIELNCSLKSILKNDTILYAVMSCILLFDPSCDKIKDKQLVSSIQDKYLVLMRHYLASEFSFKYSDFYLQLLLRKLLDVKELTLALKEYRKSVSHPFRTVSHELLAELYSDI